jgi:fatty aldehyde-generating acyl-ACP reductase
MNRRYAGSRMEHLRMVMEIVGEIFSDVPRDRFLSPYSVIPLVSQITGLSAPLLGTGASRYSMFNYAIELSPKRALFRKAFEIPFAEKRLVVDDLYDAIAPCILGEEEQYLDLLVDTRFARQDRGLLGDTIGLIGRFVAGFLREAGSGDFAHIAHYGFPGDMDRECGFLKKLSAGKAERWFNGSYPVVNEMVLRNNGREIGGWIIFIANTTEQLLRDGKLRNRKILQAARMAEKLGARRAGMAGLVASFAGGGREIAGLIPTVGFTTGHAYTIGNIIEIAVQAASKTGLDMRRACVAVVGAGGSIGSGCAKLLAARGAERMVLVEATGFATRKKLEDLMKALLAINGGLSLTLSTDLEELRKADMIIVATNSPSSLIPERCLKQGAIIIDDSFPKNVSRRTFDRRGDIVLLEGGAVSLPLDADIDVARNMPDLMDAPLTRLVSCKEIYGCFAEVLTLALTGHEGSYGLGSADPALAGDIMARAGRIGFRPAPLQCFGQVVSDERFKRAAAQVKKNGVNVNDHE